MSKSFVACTSVVALALGTIAFSSSVVQAVLTRNNIIAHHHHHNHDPFNILWRPEILRRLAPGQQQLPRRRAQVDEGGSNSSSSCPGTPFLWKIVEDATGDHVGFGIGTMHFPPDLATTDEAFNSLTSAVEDSCDVYGEVDGTNILNLIDLLNCTFSALSFAATLQDIPDEGLRDDIKAKISEITMQYLKDADQNTTATDAFISSFDAQPIGNAMNFILHGNTPEFMEVYGDTLFTGEPTGLVDSEILKLGRPSGGLEDMKVTCDLIEESFITFDGLNETYTSDPDKYAAEIRESFNTSLSQLLNLYKCGDVDAMKASGIFDVIENGEDVKTFERNNQMAAKIHEVLTARNADEKMTFAIGLAHWLFGAENMITLLEDYGYSMELIPDWNATQAESPSNEFCGVVENPDVSVFNPSLYVDPASLLNETMVPSAAPDDTSMVPTTATTEDKLSIETSTPTTSSEGMTTDTTEAPLPPSTLSPSSYGPMTTNSPTAMQLPTGSSSTIEFSKILFVLGWISMVW